MMTTAVAALALSLAALHGVGRATNPSVIYAYDMDGSSSTSRTLMASLAGIVARTSPEVQMGYQTSTPASDPEFWLNRYLENNPGASVNWQSNPLWFIDRYKTRFSGYVVYDGATINQATSVSGALGALMVEQSQLAGPIGTALSQAGLTEVEDVRGRSSDWVYDNYSFNPDLIYRQQSNKPYQLRSHAVLNNGFVFDENGATRDRFLDGQNDHSLVLGWGYNNDEGEFFSSASQNNLMTVPADFLQSAAAPSRWEVGPQTRPAKADPATPTNANAHYVAFVMSDGDNAQWLTNDFPTSDRWFGSPHRGDFPMTFDMTPALAEINPTALKYFYDQAAGDAHPTTFVTAGGHGINYPSQLGDVTGYVDATVASMQNVDQNIISILDVNYDTGVLNALAARPEIDGVMFKTNSGGYADNGGAIYWHNGTPVASVRHTLWDGFSTPNSLIATLNSAPRQALTNTASYSLINVHPWSTSTAGGGLGDPMSNVDYIVSNLAPGVEVVTLDEFFVHLTNNRATLVGAPVGDNLVANADFETLDPGAPGRPANWFYAVGNDTELVFADSNGIGERAAAINVVNADWRSAEIDLDSAGVNPGDELIFSFDFMFLGVADGDGFRGDARFFNGPQGEGGTFVGETAPFVDAASYSNNEWHSFTTTAIVPAGAEFGDLRFSTYFGGFGSGQVLIDNVTLTQVDGLVGDYNRDGTVDASDYTVWRDTYGQSVAPGFGADGNSDGVVGEADYQLWALSYGASEASQSVAAPEPGSLSLLAAASIGLVFEGLLSRGPRRRSDPHRLLSIA